MSEITKEDAIQLGIKSQKAQELFQALGWANTQTDPSKREAQIREYETARANMHEAMNRHHAALKKLGLLP